MKSLLEDPLLLGVAPQPKGWNTEKIVGWLDTHPVNGGKDVDYLTRIVANRKALATQIAQQQDNASNGGEKFWTGKYPYLCLIHCLVDNDKTKRLYLQRNKIETEKHNLLGSSLNPLNISVTATNGGMEVLLVILDRASRTMADEDNALWESTMQSNNMPSSKKQSVVYTSVQKQKEPWR
jgi:hypothetical protein